jgi:hypothetical protein
VMVFHPPSFIFPPLYNLLVPLCVYLSELYPLAHGF